MIIGSQILPLGKLFPGEGGSKVYIKKSLETDIQYFEVTGSNYIAVKGQNRDYFHVVIYTG